MKKKTLLTGLLAGMVTVVSLAGPGKEPGKWVTLFDGKSIKGWHTYLKNDAQGWKVDNGTLTTDGKGGDLVTDKEYGNFELEFEFKVQPKGNSGVIYKVIEDASYKQAYMTGPEYQVIDDKGYEWRENGQLKKLNNNQLTGANYDMLEPETLSLVKPAGEWNTGRIVINNNHVEHWLNGKQVVEYDYGSDNWKALVAKSKFKDWKYADPHPKGKIALQGHGDIVWYKNIRIREL